MNIEVVLTENDPKLGKRGDVIKVSPGFAQNFLFPHNKAKLATQANVQSFLAEKARNAKSEAERLEQAKATGDTLSKTPLTLEVQAGDGEKLYGAVTNQDIAAALAAKGIAVDRKDIHLAEPIKKIGSYQVPVKLHRDVQATLKIEVVKKKMKNAELVGNREKLPPQNLEAEAAVLGSMLIEEDAIALGIENLSPESFYRDAHKKIFQSMINLFNENKAVDLVTLTEMLSKDGVLDEVGGSSYLAQLTTAVPTAANILYYARIVKEKYILRHLITSATQIVQDSFDTTEDVEGLLDRAEKAIFDIASKKFAGGIVPMKDIVRNQIEIIDRLYQRKEHVTGIATGFHEFDTQTAGLQPSDLIVVAARPSMGKSAFVTCIAEHVGIILKQPVAIFSLEMSKEQLIQRMLCSRARVNAQNVRTGFLTQSDWPKLTSAAAKLSEAPIYIDDSPGMTVLELKAKARRLKAQFDIKMIVVDYLQLMQGAQGLESRQQEISEISRSLKGLAREVGVPLIAVSQLSRAVESRQDHKPQLSDLRESGAIEQDADVVVLLLREEYYNPTEENRGKAEVIIAKQRNGPIGSINLTFVREYTRFENAELVRREEMA